MASECLGMNALWARLEQAEPHLNQQEFHILKTPTFAESLIYSILIRTVVKNDSEDLQ